MVAYRKRTTERKSREALAAERLRVTMIREAHRRSWVAWLVKHGCKPSLAAKLYTDMVQSGRIEGPRA